MESFEVIIPTFINPHLFWVIESKNENKKREVQDLMRDIQIKENDLDASFEIGEIVAVQYGKTYYRAIIEDIKDENEKGMFYLCWLIDYGTILETSTIFKLPAHIRRTKPVAMQASLNNIVYVQQHLSFDEESGQPKKFMESVTSPTSLAHQISLEQMMFAKKFTFTVENKVDGLLLGDVLYEKDNEMKSLRQDLIDKGVLIINEILFQEIQENIYNYKETHLGLIVQVCKKLNLHLTLEEKKTQYECQNIISKYLEEFDNNDMCDDEVLQPFKIRRGRRSHGTAHSNTLNSENDSVSDYDVSKKGKDVEVSDSSSCNMEQKKNRAKLVLEKLKKNQRSVELKNDRGMLTDDSQESENKENKVKPKTLSAKQKLEEYMRMKKLELSIKRNKDDSSSSVDKDSTSEAHHNLETSEGTDETPKMQKRSIPKNVIFQPGGATYTMMRSMVTSTPKSRKNVEKHKKASSDDTDGHIKPSSDNTDSRVKSSSDDTDLQDKPLNKTLRDLRVTSDNASTTEETESENQTSTANEEQQRVGQLNIKPHCSCKQCQHWTHESDWQTQLNYCDESAKTKQLLMEKPPPLFKDNECLDEDRCIMALDYSSVTKVQKQAMFKLIVHGEYSPRPIKLVSQASFHNDIHKMLHQLEYRETKRIQMYSWPGIFRNEHVCMISGPQTGKTMGYLPIMLTFLLEKNERYEPLLKACGPIIIVLCASSKKCEDVYDLAKIILGRNRAKISLVSYPITHINARHIDFLVTTPPVLIDLIKSNAITFKRLCHLVLEDGDKILSDNMDVAKIFSLTQNMLEHRLCLKPVQLIICAEHWNSRIESVMKRLEMTPLVCIANYLEAALYGKMKFSMRFINSACKEHELKNLLKETHKICKSVIVCKNEEINDVQTILMLKGIDATVLPENMSKETILYLEEVWTNCKGGQYTVLVCTDFLLNTLLTITSASLLIHYSLPVSWSKFVKRFSCLLENCRSPLDSKQTKIKCQSVVLCDEECEEHMQKFFNFIDATELKHQLPGKFQEFSKDLKNLEEEKKLKSEVSLCDTLKLFGTCQTTRCVQRHIVDKNLDVYAYLPQAGKLKFKIIYVQDVTMYTIELLQHIDMENKVHEFDNIVDVTEELTDIMKISRKRIVAPVVGHLYAYYAMDEAEGMYYRCELMETDNECAKVKLIDKGNIVSTVKARLYRLPKEFNDTTKPRKIYDGILANLIPPYGDETFSARSFFHLKNLLQKHDYTNVILTGDVHLQLGSTFWLKNVCQEVVLSDKVVPGFQLNREILRLKLATFGNDQLSGLYALCNKAGIQLPKYEKEVVKVVREEKKVKPQWAHIGHDEVCEVIFSAAVSPNEIYVRLYKFNHLLYTLQKEIQESLRKPNYPNLKNVEIGTICLAQDDDGQYARVIVLNTEVTPTGGRALCFFVDFGDDVVVDIPNLKHIHAKFITKLPFQTMQCRLHGIAPNLAEWQQEAVGVLYEYAMEPETDIFRSLYIKSCGKENNVVLPKQNRYSVLLKDGFGEKRVLINNLLVDCGLAIPNAEEGISDFDIPEKIETGESEEELEKIIDICKKTEEVDENFCHNKSENALEKLGPEGDELDIFVTDTLKFFTQLISSKRENPITNRERELPVQTAVPAVDYCTPDVLWSQTEKIVKMDIKLTDVEHYTINLTKGRILNFKTVQNEKTYILKLMLYEVVETIQHTAMGPQVRVKLTKRKEIEWPRLILTKQNARNIHYDLSTINVEEKRKKVLELPGVFDESESDDDKIDMMYNVSSDIDSDFDFEMERDSD